MEKMNKPGKRLPTLLRYPGGKTRAVKHILPLVPDNIKTLISPFFGGGSVELGLLTERPTVKGIGYDIFKPLVYFWQMLTDKSYRHLLPTMLKYIDYARKSMTKERFKVCQEELRFWNSRDDIPSDIALKLQASLFFILNRCSFSGTTLSGGSSPGFARFTEGAVNKLHDFIDAIPYYDLRIENKSFEQVLTDLPGNNYPEPFIYLDPPYLIESKLYGNKGDTHHSFDHQLLAEKLLQLPKDIPWLLSYNDCPEIRKLYKSCSMLTPKWKYGMSSNKNSQELLIFPKSISADIRKRAKLAWQHK